MICKEIVILSQIKNISVNILPKEDIVKSSGYFAYTRYSWIYFYSIKQFCQLNQYMKKWYFVVRIWLQQFLLKYNTDLDVNVTIYSLSYS